MALHSRKKLVRNLVAAGIVASVPSAFAQQTQKVEKVEVTGTRIQAPELEGASPVAVIRAEDIKIEGARNVESFLNNLPQVLAEYGSNDSNGATGTATVNLRNLGSTRTLVLVNGRRLPPGSPANGGIWAADLNQIPAGLIKRVDVLTGGASAVYGSDAIAGVVNFIMNDSFEGVQAEVNHSFYNHQQNNSRGIADIVRTRSATNPANFKVPGDRKSDGETLEANLTLGGNFAGGKGNAVVFLGYKEDKPLLQSDRDFSACSLNASGANFVCGGSGTSFPGQFILNGGAGPVRTVADAAGNPRPYVGANDQYNFGPLNYYQRPGTRYTFDAFAHYDILPNARVYTEFAFHDYHTVAQIAPSGLFGVPAVITFENPLLSAGWRTAMGLNAAGDTNQVIFLRRNVEGGGRQDDLRHTSFRGVLGVKGDIFTNWNYDVYGTSGRVVMQEIYRNDFSITRGTRALDVVSDANGNPVCRSALDGTDPTCVPYNIWRLGGVTPAALAYLQTPGMQKGFTSQTVLGGTMSADLGDYGIKFPGAKSGIGVAFGVERRVDELQLEVDNAYATGDLAGQGGPQLPVQGQISVKDVFVEGRLPILEGAPGAHLLSLNGSYRRSDYSIDKKTNTYGIGIEYAPMKQARFRGSYQHAVRAPNVIDLYTPQFLALYNNDADPCAGSAPTATAAQCARTGVTAAQYGNILDNPAGQYNGLFGGNPNLRPETAKSATVGIVFEPMANISASIDFFRIKIEDVIATLPGPTIVDQCLQTGNPLFCSLITRDQAGTLWLLPAAQVQLTNVNIAKWQTSGVDLSASYTQKLGAMGGLNVSFNGTYMKEFVQEPVPGLGEYDCAGLFGTTCGVTLGVLPKWRHKARGTWTTPWDMDLALTWRHISKVKNEGTSSDPDLTGPVAAVESKMDARNYIDIAGSWRINKLLTLTAGINNVFDKDPPVVSNATAGAPFGNGNTYPNLYDALGRKLFFTLTAKF